MKMCADTWLCEVNRLEWRNPSHGSLLNCRQCLEVFPFGWFSMWRVHVRKLRPSHHHSGAAVGKAVELDFTSPALGRQTCRLWTWHRSDLAQHFTLSSRRTPRALAHLHLCVCARFEHLNRLGVSRGVRACTCTWEWVMTRGGENRWHRRCRGNLVLKERMESTL